MTYPVLVAVVVRQNDGSAKTLMIARLADPAGVVEIDKRGDLRTINDAQWRIWRVHGLTPKDGELFVRAIRTLYHESESSFYGAPTAVELEPTAVAV